ncbi:Carboxylic ester hydrolase [Aphelenchoides bicaudatus]|nr:Carboxylic ester hydrolase [Aphelenchoides bicaudatus]
MAPQQPRKMSLSKNIESSYPLIPSLYHEAAVYRRRPLNPKVLICILLSIFMFAIFIAFTVGSKDDLVVELDVGRIKGVKLVKRGMEIDYFLGVPFAEPPIGSNRFEKTVPLNPWSGIKETTAQKPFCSHIIKMHPVERFSEDCLYMNIVRPHKKKLLPVVFAIHGGQFEVGGATIHGLRGNRGMSLLRNDIILVAVQYRLAVFGFASTGKQDLPGNFGLFDQAEALKFVYRNIKAFGGDPKRITVFGYSAGAASATILSLSPYTHQFVHQVIGMSGSSMSIWANSDISANSTAKLIEVLGLIGDETVKERLKRAPTEDLYKVMHIIGTTQYGQDFNRFSPRIDGDFFPTQLPEMIRDAPPKPVVIGMTVQESLVVSNCLSDFIYTLTTLTRAHNTSTSTNSIRIRERSKFSAQNLHHIIEYVIKEDLYGNETQTVRNKVFNFYDFANNSTTKDNIFYLRRYTQFISDLQFNVPILREIQMRGRFGWPIYAYSHPYLNISTLRSHCPIAESHHGTDKEYAPFVLGLDNPTTDDELMEQQTAQWIVNFVKNGNPSTPKFEWKSTSFESPFQYADLHVNPKMESNFYTDRLNFWNQLTREYNYDQVQMRPIDNSSVFKLFDF